MKLRIRGPGGASKVELGEDATIEDLLSQIKDKTGITNFDAKYGYPPKPLELSSHPASLPLSKLDVKLDNEQLIISAKDLPAEKATTDEKSESSNKKSQTTDPATTSGVSESSNSSKKISLQKKAMLEEVPELPLPGRGATLVLRVMPDDNSCLFRAFSTANGLPYETMAELRSLIASAIQAEPDVYSKVVLEQDPDDYCRWIKTADAWGGAIEMGILANHFEVEVCSIDVQSLRIDKFNEGAPTRCILVYSGIHYDTIVQTPYPDSDQFDKRIWGTDDDEILFKSQELCQTLQAKHYFTDTGGMAIKCEDCGIIVYGEGQASGHAQQFGHYNMAEVTA